MPTTPRRVLLVEPPFYRLFKDTYSLDRHPLALGYLAGAIRAHSDWAVRSYNADFTCESEPLRVSHLAGEGFTSYLAALRDPTQAVWQQVQAVLKQEQPDVLGISAKTQNFASARMVAKLAKAVNPAIKVVVGGPHPSMVGQGVFECPDIDVAVCGEGEETIVELLEAFDGRRDLQSVRGIVYRQGSQARATPPRPFIADLDSLPFPHELAPQVLREADRYPAAAFGRIFATRGCPFNCFFCGSRQIWSRQVRYRSPANVAREIALAMSRGLRHVHFDDDSFGIRRDYILELCAQIRQQCPGLTWGAELHANLVEDDVLAAMKAAGCNMIQIGVESGNDDVLKAIRKHTTIAAAEESCRMVQRHGIELQTFFIVGFPQDTRQSLEDTYQAMKRIPCDRVIYSVFMPYPGTEAFEHCRTLGLVDDTFDVSVYNHQSPVNYFCPNVPPEEFRAFRARCEKLVDRRNVVSDLKRSLKTRLRRWLGRAA